MKKVFLLFLVVFCFLGLKSQVNGLLVGDTNNIKIVKVWGTHYDRGFAYGSLLGADVTTVFNNYLKPQFGSYYPSARNMVTAGQDLKFDSIFVVEAKAMVEGMDAAGTNTTNMDFVDMLVCNSFLDVAKLMSKSMGMGCSSLISWGDATAGTDLDGKSVISRHLDWEVNNTLVSNQVICIHLPSEADEQPWLGIGFAGMNTVLSGFNQNLGVFQHMMNDYVGGTVHGKQFEPIWFSLRKAIEKLDANLDGANNVLDLQSVLMEQSEGFADGYLISAVARSSEIQDSLIAMIAEIAPTSPYLTFRSNNYADSIPGDNLYTANYQIARNNTMHFGSRYNSMRTAIGTGTGIGSQENWELMRDHSHLSGNIQFMQYAPEFDLFQIAVYGNYLPAYQNDPIQFSISELLSHPVGYAELEGSKSLVSFYPNPTDDVLFIGGLENPKGDVIISVYDLTGKSVMAETKYQAGTTIKLELGAFPKGVYFVKLNSDQTFTSFKVVKE
jgi:Secretion system C-terminal sorting domain